MRYISFLLFFIFSHTYADTIESYMGIVNKIPTMEMKASPEEQAWVRSARTVLMLTNESIAETLKEANEIAANANQPLFCLPPDKKLDAALLTDLIPKAYQSTAGIMNNPKLTVSQVALLALKQNFPCNQANAAPVNQPSPTIAPGYNPPAPPTAAQGFNAPPAQQQLVMTP